MANTIVLVPPILYIPAYGGKFSNGKIIGYGSIRDNVNKVNKQGYFVNGKLDNSPIDSQYIEWTSAPEQVLMVIGNFIGDKVDGIVYNYTSTGSIYCESKQNLSNVLARRRYIRAIKTKQNCTAGTINSTTSMGTVTLLMNWVNNNLLNALDIGDVDISGNDYEIDDAVRVNSNTLISNVKNNLTNSIYNS